MISICRGIRKTTPSIVIANIAQLSTHADVVKSTPKARPPRPPPITVVSSFWTSTILGKKSCFTSAKLAFRWCYILKLHTKLLFTMSKRDIKSEPHAISFYISIPVRTSVKLLPLLLSLDELMMTSLTIQNVSEGNGGGNEMNNRRLSHYFLYYNVDQTSHR